MRKFIHGFSAALVMVLFFATLALAYPSHIASPRAVFDDGAVPQDMELLQNFRNSYLREYPSSSYRDIGEKFDNFFGPSRWWNYDEYNVVMAGMAMIDGARSKLRISFYREGAEPVWISYIQVNGETVYYWDRDYNQLDLQNLLRQIYALH